MSKHHQKEIRNAEDYRDVTLDAVEDFNRQDYEAALGKFLAMARVNPKNAKVQEMLCYVYLRKGEVARAEESYRNVLEIERENHPGLAEPITFEDLVKRSGNLEDAERQYEELIREDHLDPMRHFDVPSRLSILYMSRGEYERAANVIERFREKC
jgi:tetratricopeptide (TPR) repeat protein